MSFVTKLDYSSNRQIKQFLLTDTQLSGTTTFGISDVLIPMNFSGDTINIDALQYIQARGVILPNSIPEFTGTTFQNLGRDNTTGKIVAISGGTGGSTTDDYTISANLTGTILEFTRDLGGTYNVDLSSISGTSGSTNNTDDYTTNSTFNTSNGILEFTRLSGSTYNVDLDGRYLNSSGYTVPTGLEAINEGNGIGWRLIGKSTANVGNNGYHAIDMGEYYSPSSTAGALATHSFIGNGDSNSIRDGSYGAFTLGGGANTILGTSVGAGALGNFNTITQGYGALASGAYNTINTSNFGGGYLALGHGNDVTGDWPLGAIGLALSVNSRNHLVVGVSNTIYTGTTSASDRPIFTVGIGTHTNPTGKWVANVRKSGFNVNLNGEVIADSLTNTLIDAETTGRVLTTRNYLETNYVKIGKRIVVSGDTTYNLDHNLATDWKFTMTGNTTFTESNLPTGDNTLEFTIKLTGNYTPTWPIYWDVLGDDYDGDTWNFIAVQIHDGNSGFKEVTTFISNM